MKSWFNVVKLHTYAPFIMHKLMQGTLAKQKRQVLLTISDNNELLYDDNSENDLDKDNSPLFSKMLSWKCMDACGLLRSSQASVFVKHLLITNR
jgi:hypothetical protein